MISAAAGIAPAVFVERAGAIFQREEIDPVVEGAAIRSAAATTLSQQSCGVCLEVELSTPTVRFHPQRVSVWKYDTGDWGSFYGDDVAELTPNTPGVLIDRKVNLFGW